MRKLLSILSFVLLYVTIAFGQAVDFTVLVQDGVGNSQVLNFGLDLAATDGIDAALGESDLPPPPPGNAFDARWWLPPFAGALSSWLDYRAPGATPPGAFPFTGNKQHVIKFQSTDFPITISWSGLPPEIAGTSYIRDPFGLQTIPFVGTGSIVISLAAIPQVEVSIDYVNIGPSGPAPEFVLSPTSLNFGPVGVGLPSTLQANVSNPGTDPLDITSVTSSDPQFTFAPAAAIIPAGGNLDFDITFTPTSLGTHSADITFTHNAPTSPDVLPVTGVGADAGPTFGVSPASLTFSTLVVGNSDTKQLTVTNNGLTNTLNISSVSVGDPVNYSVAPTTATIPPFGTQVFNVTFAPTVAGPLPTDVTFVHDAPSSPDVVPVTGAGFVPAAVSGLVFEQDTAFVLEGDFYPEKMQLVGTIPGPDIQAIQFRLLTNMAPDDNTILTFQNLQKGSNVADPSWVLDYNLVRGDITANGASEDTIYVLLYNLEQNNGLATGVDYLDLLTVNYRVADLPALVDYSKSSIEIMFAEGSTYEGFPVDITPSDSALEVVAKNRVGSWGDVNGDGCLDILDLIMVVDHIVSRDSLDADEFLRADIAPWTPGNELPDPDGFVNVQDLSLIQNIILTGLFPNGDPVGPCGPPLLKFNGQADATVNIYINSEGISAYLDSKVGIRGAQIELANVVNSPDNLVINTPLGQGYYNLVGDIFKTLMYDRLGQKYIEDGVNKFMADLPFVITNPEDISLEKLILVDINQRKVLNIDVNLIYANPQLPYDYILWQNYPNPFNPTTAVRFQVPKTGDVTIKIYDMLGQEVRTLFAGEVLRGTYTVDWDGLNDAGVKMSSGSYIYRMTAGEFVQSKKMLLLK